MNKSELVAKIVEKSELGVTPKQASEMVNSLTATITEALADGDEVALVGFGTFKVTERKAREGRNPQTGETLKIAAKKAPTFKAGKALKEAVN